MSKFMPSGDRMGSVMPGILGLCCLLAPRTGCLATIAPFTEEALARGVNYVIQPWPQIYGLDGFGCGFVDFDNDGDNDIIIMGAASGRVGMFENDGTGHFTDRSSSCGIPYLFEGSAFAAADYDGDGLIDLYFTQMGEPNVLMHNTGAFTFADVTQAAGVGDPGAGTGCAWGDFDQDGLVDLYVCNYNGAVPGTSGLNNLLYHNNGNGTFTNVAPAQGVDDSGYGFESTWFDMDRDGDLDLYLTNDRGHLPPLYKANRLWRNDGGHFTDVSASSGAGMALFAMGLGVGDFDGNGFPDLYVTNLTNYAEGWNRLLLNQGNGTFIESHDQAGVGDFAPSWGAIFFDFDNNGHLDLYVNNQYIKNKFYSNSGSFPCPDVAAAAAVEGTYGQFLASFSSAVGDVNGDGAQDLLLNNTGGNVQLFINHEGVNRNYIRYRIAGEGANTKAIGANIDTRTATQWQIREVYAGGNGYKGQNELIVHVGVGAATLVDQAIVRWPDHGTTRVLTSLPVNQTWTIYPPSRLGDADGDGDVDVGDFGFFASCFGGPIEPGREMMDFNGDSSINGADYNAFLSVFRGPVRRDCNANGVTDMLEILSNPALDANHNGELDACECPGDIAPAGGDGVVGIDDLLAIINDWGPCPGCATDISANGVVNIDDLLAVIGAWGPCP